MAKKQKTRTLHNTDEIFEIFAKKAGFKKRVFYPVYPLKEGCYSRLAAGVGEPKPKIETDETGSRLLEEPEDPLTDYWKKVVLYLTKGKGLFSVR